MQKYRPCAGAVVFNKKGQVLLGARNDTTGDNWQFPQGGIENNETPAQAAMRELFEEMSVSSVELVHIEDEPIYYDFPNNIKENFRKRGIFFEGQAIYFGLFFFNGHDEEISIETAVPEFKKCEWKSIDFAVSHIVEFKKDVYSHLAKKFTPLIKQYLENLS